MTARGIGEDRGRIVRHPVARLREQYPLAIGASNGGVEAANIVGCTVLIAASAAYAAGADVLGLALGALVAALALFAAATGFCTGCEAYKVACRVSGRPFVSCPLPPRASA